MNLKEAIALIAFENINPSPQLWLDLGCGTGLFTQALTSYLPAGSRIIAVDKNKRALTQVSGSANNVTIETVTTDFINDALEVKEADGILMANSLHYVRDKETFLHKLASYTKRDATFLIVEYDRPAANKWVPYPLTIDAAKTLFETLGYSKFRVLNKRTSVYGGHVMYATLIRA